MKDEHLLVMVTFPSAEEARQIGTQLIELQAAACVNLIPSVTSIYRWDGHVREGEETLAVIKTTVNNYPELEARIQALHPYDVPELVAVKIDRGSKAYLAWLSDVTRD